MDLVKNDACIQVSFDFHSSSILSIDTKIILWQARSQNYSLQSSMPALMHQVLPIIAFRLKCHQLIPFPQDPRPLHPNVRIQIRHYGSEFVWTISVDIGWGLPASWHRGSSRNESIRGPRDRTDRSRGLRKRRRREGSLRCTAEGERCRWQGARRIYVCRSTERRSRPQQ